MYTMNLIALLDTIISNTVILNFAKENFTPTLIVLLLQELNLALNNFQELSFHLVSFNIDYLLCIKEVHRDL